MMRCQSSFKSCHAITALEVICLRKTDTLSIPSKGEGSAGEIDFCLEKANDGITIYLSAMQPLPENDTQY